MCNTATILAHLCSEIHFVTPYLGRHALTKTQVRNNVSGPEIGLPGRILAGLLPGKHRNGPCNSAAGGSQTPAPMLCNGGADVMQ